MKKRMLITTIVMMLVLAVALTTSSLAWFSASQANVTATGGQFTAETAGTAANIGVANSINATNWKSTSPMEVFSESDLMPVVAINELPISLAAPLSESKTLATLKDENAFNGANYMDAGDTQWFPLNTANPATNYALGSQGHHAIYANNLDKNSTTITSLTVKLTLATTSETAADPNFYIVLTQKDGSSENVIRTAVMCKAGGYVVFNFSGDDVTSTEDAPLKVTDVEANKVSQYGETGSEQNIPTIAVGTPAEVTFAGLSWTPGAIYGIHVFSWYEGKTLDVTTDGCVHTYTLGLTAAV